mmetsp:Transcript_120760/g.352695  ORF Transcript_120760/g.352695 Transcript_120760/m.352695 type:complete len:310 (+) Transcript_120760:1493-2422(+)
MPRAPPSLASRGSHARGRCGAVRGGQGCHDGHGAGGGGGRAGRQKPDQEAREDGERFSLGPHPGRGDVQRGRRDYPAAELPGGAAPAGSAASPRPLHQPRHGGARPALPLVHSAHGAGEHLLARASDVQLPSRDVERRDHFALEREARRHHRQAEALPQGRRPALVRGRGRLGALRRRRVRGLRGQEEERGAGAGSEEAEDRGGRQAAGRLHLPAAHPLQAPAAQGRRPRGAARGCGPGAGGGGGGGTRRAREAAGRPELLLQALPGALRLPERGPAGQHDGPPGLGGQGRAGGEPGRGRLRPGHERVQ